MESSQKFDDALFSILVEAKTLPEFFDVVFGFLSRRTDFYHIATDKNSPIGLPPGWAENYVKRAFIKWKPKENDKRLKEEIRSNHSDAVPEPVQELEITQEIEDDRKTEVDEYSTKVKCNEKDGFTSSEFYNGAVCGTYSWSQSIKEVDVHLKVPDNTKTKDISVTISPKKLRVELKNEVLLEGELCQKCKYLDAIWSLGGSKLEIHLEKSVEMWWNCLLLDEPKLDVSKIDCSRPFEELPEEAQAKIEELTWNHERKRLGLPTSEELAMQEKLKKAWNAEGSPFKGPFDPNAISFK